jgi:hypothetical protein
MLGYTKRKGQKRAVRTAMLMVGLLAATITIVATGTPANASLVYNRFERHCISGGTGCGAFVQTNPPYRSAYGNDCWSLEVFGADQEWKTSGRPVTNPC